MRKSEEEKFLKSLDNLEEAIDDARCHCFISKISGYVCIGLLLFVLVQGSFFSDELPISVLAIMFCIVLLNLVAWTSQQSKLNTLLAVKYLREQEPAKQPE